MPPKKDPDASQAEPAVGEPGAGDIAPLDDLNLLRAAPLRVREWLMPPLLLGLAGGGAVAALITLAVQKELTVSGWAALSVATVTVALASTLAWFGHRAYTRATTSAVRSFLIVRTAGFLALATWAVIAGVVGLIAPLLAAGLGAVGVMFLVYRSAPADENPAAVRIVLSRMTRQLLLANGLVLVLLPVAAALYAVAAPFSPSSVAAQYLGRAIALPVGGALVIVWALRAARATRAAQ